jgi:hypothetical protein
MSKEEALLLSGLFTSLVLPVLISWIKSDAWPKWVRFVVSVVISGIGGVLVAFGNGELDFSATPVMIIIGIVTATNVFWRLFFKDTGLEDVLHPQKDA